VAQRLQLKWDEIGQRGVDILVGATSGAAIAAGTTSTTALPLLAGAASGAVVGAAISAVVKAKESRLARERSETRSAVERPPTHSDLTKEQQTVCEALHPVISLMSHKSPVPP